MYDKDEKYRILLAQAEALLEGENDGIARMANLAALLHLEMGFWWTGFYRVCGNELILGPFLGPVACTRIARGRGVCGTAWERAETVVVPDGKPVPAWFSESGKVDVSALGPQYVVTRYGVKRDSTRVQTAAIQRVIDLAAERGGGVIVIPKGTFLSGNLFFKPGTHLLIRKGGVLKGSDRIADFQVMETRIEGQTCQYFPALVNADGVDGFTIAGEGILDGNGFHYWEEFWIRREWNRQCTNKDAQRPRLVYISNSSDVTVQDVRMRNSPYWTNHIYRCDHVRFLDLHITSSTSGVKGPSIDAIDIDACHDVLVRGCYMSVNDDAVVLKGGKGIWADQNPTDGPCRDIIIEDCRFCKTHGCLTLGSESVDDRNVILRRCHAEEVNNLLWLKMRPDTHVRNVRINGVLISH